MIAIGCDHGGLQIKNAVIEYMKENGIEYTDYGCYTEESVDYPVHAYQVAKNVADGNAELGIICCGTGIGMSMAANKHHGIRAALCADTYSARLTRMHNDANVLCIGALVVGQALAIDIVDSFLNASFEGGRHKTRVDMFMALEESEK